MCGIVGICGAHEKTWIESMNQIQTHRGPDDSGVFRDEEAKVSLAMRRLAIIDLAGGHQPMTTADGRYTIIFNGEIYNAQTLREELEKKGVKFVTHHSDTEVALQFYAEEGESMLQKLNGMFAFAIYDKEQKKIFCSRDHAGIKPLYYFCGDGHFAFASELKALLTLPFIKRELDFQSFFHYMSLMYVPGQHTIMRGINRLPAGSFLTYDISSHKLSINSWWKPKFTQHHEKAYISTRGAGFTPDYSHTLHEWKERIRYGLENAVKRWILADVSVGCSLSGGLDSSALVGLLAKSGQKVKTYSLGFTGAGESYWNELPRARAVAKKWGTDHHELVLDPEKLLDDLVSMVWHLDEPYAGGLPSFSVFQFMSKDVKVGLTGSGGDEMFGNYGKWKALEGGGIFGFGGDMQRAVDLSHFTQDFFNRMYYFQDEEKREILNSTDRCENTAHLLYRYYQDAVSPYIRDRIAYMDLLTQLPEEFLFMTDRFSMAHSLEARTPFLDKEFMELMLRVPANLRTKPHSLKYLLRETISDVLPLRNRLGRKKGFVIPLTLWLRGKLRPLAEYLLNPARLEKQGIFNKAFYTKYVEPHLTGAADYTNKVWAAVMFQLWWHVFMERKEVDKPTYTWKDIVS